MVGMRNALHCCLLITFGVAKFIEGASFIAEPVVAPMLRSVGVSAQGSAKGILQCLMLLNVLIPYLILYPTSMYAQFACLKLLKAKTADEPVY